MSIIGSNRKTSSIYWLLVKQKAKTQDYKKLSDQTLIIMLKLHFRYSQIKSL